VERAYGEDVAHVRRDVRQRRPLQRRGRVEYERPRPGAVSGVARILPNI
jgi:hypothetical protein